VEALVIANDSQADDGACGAIVGTGTRRASWAGLLYLWVLSFSRHKATSMSQPLSALQYFGRVEIKEAHHAETMLCIDKDRPHEFMFHLWGHAEEPEGFMAEPSSNGSGTISLRPLQWYRKAPNGSLRPFDSGGCQHSCRVRM
jgi:hypothetical protein